MNLKVHQVGNGLYPQEVLVGIYSAEGEKRMLIDKRALDGDFVKVGAPITVRDSNSYLVELPRETTSGEWRVWVSSDQLAGV